MRVKDEFAVMIPFRFCYLNAKKLLTFHGNQITGATRTDGAEDMPTKTSQVNRDEQFVDGANGAGRKASFGVRHWWPIYLFTALLATKQMVWM